jgi:hypothetical protein
MNTKLIIAGVAGFVVSLVGGFLFHGIVLHADYAQLLPNVMRTEADAQSHLPFLLLSHLIKGFVFAWIYTKGISPGVSWLSQGLKFGVATVFLVTIPLYLVYYSVEPMPGMLVAKQIVFDAITMILMGIVVSFITKSPVEAA